MSRHRSILEIQESGLAWSVVDGSRNSPRIVEVYQTEFETSGDADVGAAIHAALDNLKEDPGPVHVALGDRSSQHFCLSVPKAMSRTDLMALAERETKRLGSISGDVKLIMGIRTLGAKGSGHRFAVTAVPERQVMPIKQSLTERNVELGSITTLEDAIAGAVPRGIQEPVALVEFIGGRAYFVGSHNGIVEQSRRFLVPGIRDDDPSALSMHLAMEIPRTVDYLYPEGSTPPSQLLISPRLQLDEVGTDILGQTFATCDTIQAEVPTSHDTPPGLGTIGVLNQIRARRRITMRAGGDVRMPMSKRALVALPCSAMLLAGSTWIGGEATVAFNARDQQIQSLASRTDSLRLQEAELERAAAPLRNNTAPAAVQKLLEARRPVSRMVSEVTRAATDLQLTMVQYSAKNGIRVLGNARASSRMDSLQQLRNFKDQIVKIPYVEVTDESIDPKSDHIEFELRLTWRAN